VTENANGIRYYQCPHCPCIFLTKADLQKHLSCMGENKEEHADCHRRTHGRIEHGYSSE
jgi:Zn-finger nucleic acid-binding protein